MNRWQHHAGAAGERGYARSRNHGRVIIAVRARKDIETLPRLFGLIAQRGLIPSQMWYREEGGALFLDLEIEPFDALDLQRLIQKLRSAVLIDRVLVVEELRAPGASWASARGGSHS